MREREKEERGPFHPYARNNRLTTYAPTYVLPSQPGRQLTADGKQTASGQTADGERMENDGKQTADDGLLHALGTHKLLHGGGQCNNP